jgi:hypothetical protein
MDKYRVGKDSFKTYILKNEDGEIVFSGYVKEGFGELIVELMNRNNNCRHEDKVYVGGK